MLRALAIVSLLLASALAVLWWRSPIQPVAWQPGLDPGLQDVFAPDEKLSEAALLKPYAGVGPEDVLVVKDGWMYTGYEDGQIVRFRESAPQRSAQLFAHTGGRPLGLAMDANGNLIVADADKGLLSISNIGDVSVLVDSFEGEPMRFVDDLDIASDGTIWFSDASQRFGFRQNLFNFFEPSFTGRLFSYEPASGVTTLHMDGLFFANGVALGPGENYVLVNETGMARIHRLWLKGPRRGEHEVFIENLPGMPDNLSFNGKDRFWVALVSLREPMLDKLADKPGLRKVLAGLPPHWLLAEDYHGFVIAVGLAGEVLGSMQSRKGEVHTITSANEHDGKLYLGSLAMESVAVLELAE